MTSKEILLQQTLLQPLKALIQSSVGL